MARYRFLAADLLTGVIREEIPFGDAWYSHVLDRPGGFGATLPINHPKARRSILDPSATSIFVERDGVIQWGGILWTAAASESGKDVVFGAEGFHSYARRRRIRITKKYAAVDQLAIARDLMTYMQSVTGGDLRIAIGAETSGTLRDRTYYFYERKPIGEALEQLAAVNGGFDFSYSWEQADDVVDTAFHLHYPKRGKRTELVLDLGTNLEDVGWNIDGTAQANLVDTLGEGEGDKMKIGVAQDVTQLGHYPLLEETYSYKDVKKQDTLNGHAAARLKATATPIETYPTLIARTRADLTIGSFITGDSITVRANGGFLEIDDFLRVISYKVSVGNEGQESVAIGFGDEEL